MGKDERQMVMVVVVVVIVVVVVAVAPVCSRIPCYEHRSEASLVV